MELEIKDKIISIMIILEDNEIDMLKELILFAFDYEGLKPNSLYTSEKDFGKLLVEKLEEVKK